MSCRFIDLVSIGMEALGLVDDWPADRVAVGVASARGTLFVHGDTGDFGWASVTKPVTALACLVAAEEGTLDLDEPAGPPGATVRHLLAHASGLSFDPGAPIAKPGTARTARSIKMAGTHKATSTAG